MQEIRLRSIITNYLQITQKIFDYVSFVFSKIIDILC